MPIEDESALYASMRSVISLVDKLRDFNLDSYLSLPRIAVLGEQSAGKSSLLEAICGLNFLPRGAGIVTRRPLELRMVRADVDEPVFTFPKDFGEREFSRHADIVAAIEELTERETRGTKGVSEKPITCVVRSAAVPDLTLVDLPGITRNAVAGQPTNIEQLTKDLAARYCRDENTLILCVIPANIDLSTSDALSLARKFDAPGARTLAVLTKIDIVDEGADCREALLNRLIPLRHGYVGVRGRSQLEVQRGVPVAAAVQKEAEFFAQHPLYRALPRELLGTRALVERASDVLQRMIRAYLPRLQGEVANRLQRARAQLEALGDELPTREEERLELVFRLVRTFTEGFDRAVNGRFYPKKATNRRERDDETIPFQLNALFGELFRRYSAADFRVSADLSDAQIERALETYQSSSIPGFYSIDSFLALIHPKIERLREPILQLLEDCKTVIELRGGDLLGAALKKFGRLHSEVQESFVRFLAQSRNAARRVLDGLIRAEENYLFTNDPAMLDSAKLDRSAGGRSVQVLEMRLRIDNYFAIVVRNLRDCVPKIVGQFLVRNFNARLEVELLNALSKKDYCLDSLAEADTAQSLRAKLKAELAALYAADVLLASCLGAAKSSFAPSPGTAPETETETKLSLDVAALDKEFLQFNRDLAESRAARFRPRSPSKAPRLSATVRRPYVVVGSTPDKGGKATSAQPGAPPPSNARASLPTTTAATGFSWLNPFTQKAEPARPSGEPPKPKSVDPFDVPLIQGVKAAVNGVGLPPAPLASFNRVFASSNAQRQTAPAGETAPAAKKPNTGSLFGDDS